MLSFWEKESFIRYDLIIIGSGIVGLSVAIEYREKYPDARVLILERGLLPTGASTRNAGFACMGSVTELMDDKNSMSEAQIIQLFEWRAYGLEILRKRLGDVTIGYQQNGSHELLNATELDALEYLDYYNQLLYPVTKAKVFGLANERINTFGLNTDYCKALVESYLEGELHTGKMMHVLLLKVAGMGIEIKTGASVKHFEEQSDEVIVRLDDPCRGAELQLYAQQLAICTNASTRQFFDEEDVVPGRGQVVITKPVPKLRLRGIFHMDKGYYYFRAIENRILFGGGRNLDFETEQTTTFAFNEPIIADLKQKLETIILPDTPFEIEQRWTGIMAFGHSKFPIIKQQRSKIFAAFRLGGMGVALGSKVARELVKLM